MGGRLTVPVGWELDRDPAAPVSKVTARREQKLRSFPAWPGGEPAIKRGQAPDSTTSHDSFAPRVSHIQQLLIPQAALGVTELGPPPRTWHF